MTMNEDADVPLECSQDEFEELCSNVASLTTGEAEEELLDCARFGEVDAVRAILDVNSGIVDTVDESGSTALHKACANGHVSTTRLLLKRGASHLANRSGNTPLHWAAAAGHQSIVALLLEELRFDIDVLQKNEFGRSALTEGFSSQNTQLVKLLLEHDSASEDRLLSGGTEVDADEAHDELERNDQGNDHRPARAKATVTHDFVFTHPNCEHELDEPRSLRIRELPIDHADNPFGEAAIEDTTGYGIWSASLVLARWMASEEISKQFADKTVLELGAGCGVPGLAAAFYSNASQVYITDLNPTTIDNLRYNVALNGYESQNEKRVIAGSIDWDDEATWPAEKLDFVIGSDLIYQASIVPLLKKVVLGLLKPNEGRFLYAAPDTGRDGLDLFIESMKSDGCELVSQTTAPNYYLSNPLLNGDDDECFLHFHELASSTYILYEWRRR